MLLLASALATVGLSLLGVAFLRRRAASLLVSALVIAGCVLALLPSPAPDPARRPEPANRSLAQCAQQLRDEMAHQLQSTGDAPVQEVWARGVRARCPSLVRDRRFAALPLQLTWLSSPQVPADARAGTLAVYRSGDGAHFTLHPIGWGPEGEAMSLTSENRTPLWLQATYNPQL